MDEREYRGDCDYPACEKEQLRHFASKHFCNEHNRMLRRQAKEGEPRDVWEWVEKLTND